MPQTLETPVRKVENNHKRHTRASSLLKKNINSFWKHNFDYISEGAAKTVGCGKNITVCTKTMVTVMTFQSTTQYGRTDKQTLQHAQPQPSPTAVTNNNKIHCIYLARVYNMY
jgi:hypothetical protein